MINGTVAAASSDMANIGRNLIQPMAMTISENEVAMATQAKVTPSPTMSRTIGIQDAEKNINERQYTGTESSYNFIKVNSPCRPIDCRNCVLAPLSKTFPSFLFLSSPMSKF